MIHTIAYYFRTVGARGLTSAARAKLLGKPALLQMNRSEIKFPFFLRVPSSDVCVFEQTFLGGAYDLSVDHAPRTIVDAGANTGLASIYFANRFPDATVIAIEPEADNWRLLKKNVAPYRNIVPVRGALWQDDTEVNLVDPHLGRWGFMTQSQNDAGELLGDLIDEVRGMTVSTLMTQYGLDRIDILKMDIEGAEREVFRDSSAWIERVDALIIELHEHLKAGCNRSFYNGSNGFEYEWQQGENVYLTRKGCCVRRPPKG